MAAPSKNFTNIPDSSVDADSPMNDTLMTQLRDNDIHLEEVMGKDYVLAVNHDHDNVNSKAVIIPAGSITATEIATGAVGSDEIATNAVGQSEIAGNAVGQSELNVTNASGSQAVGTGGSNASLNGGRWSFWTGSATSGLGQVSFGNGNTSNGIIGLTTLVGGETFYWDEKYPTASPPYNPFDQGDIPLFITLQIEKGSGNIIGTRIAHDPAWAYHGRNALNPKHMRIDKQGKKYIKRPSLPYSSAEIENDMVKLKANMAAIKAGIDWEEIEITQEVKNAGINEVPHLFFDYNSANEEILILDPYSDLARDFYELSLIDESATVYLRDLILKGDILFENEYIDILTPPTVKAVKMKWR